MSEASDTRLADDAASRRQSAAADKSADKSGLQSSSSPPAGRADAPRQQRAVPSTPAAKVSGAKPAAPPVSAAKAAAGAKPAAGPAPAKAGGKSAASDPIVPPVEEVEAHSYRGIFMLAGAVSTSLIVHLGLIIVLGLMLAVAVAISDPPELAAVQEREQELVTQIVDNSTVASTQMSAPSQSVAAVQAGHTSAIATSATEPALETEVSPDSPVTVNLGAMALVEGVPAATLQTDLPDGAPGDPQSVVDSIDEAMDRITQEILTMLTNNKVLVVWIFDESESMKDDQQEIRAKIERVYTELGLVGATRGDALMTAVASYGKDLHIHSEKPTSDPEAVKAYIDKIPIDASGEEQMCFAVGKTINHFKNFAITGRRQMAVILVTDESGDQTTNYELLEPTIAEAKKARSRIYVLGREAVFGYPYAYMRWIDPKTKIGYWLRIDRGPESPNVEQLQTNGFWRRQDAHASGFGPYEQTRMARETGGVFFMLPSPEVNLVARDDRKYELARLRPYMPSLEPRDIYARERDSSELRRTIWKVINDLNPWNPEQARHINMRDDFSIDDAEFRRQAVIEMEKAKRYVIYLDAAEKALEKLAEERRKEVYPRWQANYDLIYAQVLAYKVRIYQYGAYLQWWLDNPNDRPQRSIKPPNPRTTATNWDIRTRKDVIPTPLFPQEELDKYIAKSSELLKKVMEDHHGTPWETRAKWELARGFGVHLVQEWDDPRRGQGVQLPKY